MPQGISLVDPTAVRKSSKQNLMALVAEIEKADICVKNNTCNKLQIIANQIRFLQRQAECVLFETKRNVTFNHIPCNFVKQPGHIYHLYKRESGQFYFSMLSPEEWGNLAPLQDYKGSFRLEQDHSWTALDQLQDKNDDSNLLERFLPSDATFIESIML
ncbi:Uncharacterized protein C1orf50 like protein [Cyphomyrmex costatus]|uniref:Uncharacterized protein C1orf50 like protein n=2 Tax=Cyphomyrmex costatus TaxID=456900 RepID=A0A151I8Y9_9HYME|nr:Uncharacterized protein C1orf50 like protein [Cyphomyrmex costatus]